ncbi:MAG: polymer-forming cytoskeletal protein [Anaerolineae bacterium]|nr:polymer-forming cytoskeletal protein [Anaerolineae bacterium]
MLRRLWIGLGLLLILGNVQIAFAHDVLQGDECAITADERITGNVFVLCRVLTVSGTVDGNLYGGGFTVVIDGAVTGSIYLISGETTITGTVGGDIHFAGGVLTVEDTAELLDDRADIVSVSMSTELSAPRVAGSVTSASYQLLLNSPVAREVSFWGSALTVSGTVDGDVTATVGDPGSTGVNELRTLFGFLPFEVTLVNPGLRVTDAGMINGQLRYAGPVEGEIAVTLPRPPEYTPVVAQTDLISPEKSLLENLRDYLAQAIREVVSLALIGVVALLVMPRTLQAPIYSLRVRPLSSLGVGLLTFIISISIFFIVIPVLGAVLILLMLVLGLGDLALLAGAIILVLDLGGAGAFYFIAIFVSRVIVCIAIGRFIVRLLFGERPERYMTYVSLLIGATLLALVTSLPYIGFLVNALAAFFGLGAILMLVQREIDMAREAEIIPEPMHPEEARQLPPPVIDDTPHAPGMENLPDGFKWWQ